MFRNRCCSKIKAVLSVLISLQMTLGTYAEAANQASPGIHTTNQKSIASATQRPVPFNAIATLMAEDPIWEDFIHAHSQATDMKLSYSPQDPALDRDPFFLRSQSWVEGAKQPRSVPYEKAFDLHFRKADGAVEIALPAGMGVLRLKLPMTPVHATDDFIFLSVDRGSDLFARAAGSEEPGEGLFFISREDLTMRALESHPVPIFHFPLPGGGWTGALEAREIPEVGMLAISNQDNAIALELKDVESMMKAQQMNLLLATAMTLKNKGAVTDSVVYPAAGTTAAFGLFFTGLDLADPSKSFWADSKTTDTSKLGSLMASLLRKLPFAAAMKTLSPGQARAFDFSFELPPEVMSRLVFVGTVLTGMLALSVVLKYAHPGIRRKIVSLRPEEPAKGTVGIVGREIKEVFDVFAHMTTTSAQLPAVTFGNALELFLDRFAPSVAAAEHTLIRRFMNNSFYYARNIVRSTPVNAKMFFLGSFIMGGIDTTLVVLQYLYAVPWLCMQAAPYLDAYWKNKVDHTFEPNNPDTRNMVIQDSVRNGLAHLQSGASSYSLESRAQVLEPIEKEVDALLRAMGKNPNAPKNQSERKRLIDEKVDRALQQRGLPRKADFLFDASTLFSSLFGMLGYQAPAEMKEQESFILETRVGLSMSALRRAVNEARENARLEPSQVAREAVVLLEETVKQMSFIRGAVTHGRKGLNAARDVRRQLTLLSYEGSVESAVRYIPDFWKTRYSPEAAQLASLFFRHSLYSYLGQTEMNVATLIRKDKERSSSERAADLEESQVAQDHVKQEKAAPQRLDWLARRQHARAEAYANQKLGLAIHSKVLSEQEQASVVRMQKMWKRYYRDGLAKEVGLDLKNSSDERRQVYTNGVDRQAYTKMLKLVEKQADQLTKAQLKNEPGRAAYLADVSEFERAKIEAAMYATNFLQAYKEATTDHELIPPLDPMQPGRFQKIRQSSWVSQSRILTRVLRTFEAFGNDQALTPGWAGAFRRNVPLFSDMWASHLRLFKTTLSDMTVSYMWAYYVWQVHIPYATWGIFVATKAATIMAPAQWLSRVFRANGLKPKGGVISMAAFAFPYAWVTFLGIIPIQLFGPDANSFFDESIREPILSAGKEILTEHASEAVAAVGAMAVGAKAAVGAVRKLKEKAAFRRSQVSQASQGEERLSLRGRMCTLLFAGP